MLLGPLEPAENRGLIDFNLPERPVVLLLVLPIVWVGLYPNPILRRVEPPLSLLIDSMETEISRTPGLLPDARVAVTDLLNRDAAVGR